MNPNRNSILTALLIPFSLIYGAGVFIRNLFFDTGIFPSREFPFPVITVGNITVGGTGKTPHVEYLVSFLKDEFKIAVLSRGYRRKSSGFVVASTTSGVEDVGDEPLQIKKKFPDVEVAVSADRIKGIHYLCRHNTKIQAFILDDAFQHRWVRPGMSILLIDYNRPVSRDLLLPAGRLREPVSSMKRAVIVIVTKCPPVLSPIQRRIIIKELNLFPWQSLYFTMFTYGNPLPVFAEADPFPDKGKFRTNKIPVLMVTGIATPEVFRQHLLNLSREIKQLSFPDHHNYTQRDIRHIEREWQSTGNEQKVIITTEKDAVRLQKTPGIGRGLRSNMYYIPISVRFIENDGESFKKKISKYVRKNKRNHLIS
jgi:tetraacyldisaccharide 4'-kinase